MASSAVPWVRSLARPGHRRLPRTLILLGLGVIGAALWAIMGLYDWQVSRRPAVVIEAFIAETATAAQVEDLAQRIQDEDFFCDLRYVDSEEARAEAGLLEKIKPLLDAYGGNPFLRSLRVTLCAGEVERCREAGIWLSGQEEVDSVRSPLETVGRMLEVEKRLERVVLGTSVPVVALGLVLVLVGVRLLVLSLAPELEVYERLGASPGKVWLRVMWAVFVPVHLLSIMVALGISALSLLAMFSGSWIVWFGARLPEFPHLAGAALIAGGTACGALAGVVTALTRSYAPKG